MEYVLPWRCYGHILYFTVGFSIIHLINGADRPGVCGQTVRNPLDQLTWTTSKPDLLPEPCYDLEASPCSWWDWLAGRCTRPSDCEAVVEQQPEVLDTTTDICCPGWEKDSSGICQPVGNVSDTTLSPGMDLKTDNQPTPAVDPPEGHLTPVVDVIPDVVATPSVDIVPIAPTLQHENGFDLQIPFYIIGLGIAVLFILIIAYLVTSRRARGRHRRLQEVAVERGHNVYVTPYNLPEAHPADGAGRGDSHTHRESAAHLLSNNNIYFTASVSIPDVTGQNPPETRTVLGQILSYDIPRPILPSGSSIYNQHSEHSDMLNIYEPISQGSGAPSRVKCDNTKSYSLPTSTKQSVQGDNAESVPQERQTLSNGDLSQHTHTTVEATSSIELPLKDSARLPVLMAHSKLSRDSKPHSHERQESDEAVYVNTSAGSGHGCARDESTDSQKTPSIMKIREVNSAEAECKTNIKDELQKESARPTEYEDPEVVGNLVEHVPTGEEPSCQYLSMRRQDAGVNRDEIYTYASPEFARLHDVNSHEEYAFVPPECQEVSTYNKEQEETYVPPELVDGECEPEYTSIPSFGAVNNKVVDADLSPIYDSIRLRSTSEEPTSPIYANIEDLKRPDFTCDAGISGVRQPQESSVEAIILDLERSMKDPGYNQHSNTEQCMDSACTLGIESATDLPVEEDYIPHSQGDSPNHDDDGIYEPEYVSIPSIPKGRKREVGDFRPYSLAGISLFPLCDEALGIDSIEIDEPEYESIPSFHGSHMKHSGEEDRPCSQAGEPLSSESSDTEIVSSVSPNKELEHIYENMTYNPVNSDETALQRSNESGDKSRINTQDIGLTSHCVSDNPVIQCGVISNNSPKRPRLPIPPIPTGRPMKKVDTRSSAHAMPTGNSTSIPPIPFKTEGSVSPKVLTRATLIPSIPTRTKELAARPLEVVANNAQTGSVPESFV